MKRIDLGIIGTGIIASEAHAPALERLSDRFRVCALCNHTRPKAEALAARLGLDAEFIWQDWRLFLEEAPVEAVLVCLPIELNFPVGQAAAAAGKHVLCEKPVGQSREEAREAPGLSARYGVTYMVAEDIHFVPKFSTTAGLVAEGAIGKPRFMHWNLFRYMELSDKYAKTTWRSRHVYPGGYVLDGGVHFVHVLQMLAGRVASVRAEALSIEPKLGKIDTAMALLRHENGVLSSLNMSWRARDSSSQGLRIFGEKGALLLDESGIVQVDDRGKSRKIGYKEEDGYYLQLLEFHRAVTIGSPPSISTESAAHDVEVILALLESAEKGRTIKL